MFFFGYQELPLPTVPPLENAPAAVEQVRASSYQSCWTKVADNWSVEECKALGPLGFNDCIWFGGIFGNYQELPFPTLAPKPAAVNQVLFGNCLFSYWQWCFSCPLGDLMEGTIQKYLWFVVSICRYELFFCIFTRALFFEHILYCGHLPVVHILNCTASWSLFYFVLLVRGYI